MAWDYAAPLGGWISPRPVAPPPKPAYVPPPVTVMDGLYCCAPCGVSTLEQHLRGRNWTGDLYAELQALSARGVVTFYDDAIGGYPVRLYTIKGQR